MQTWEYREVTGINGNWVCGDGTVIAASTEPAETMLNQLGRDGWELVSTALDSSFWYHFKRPIE